MLVTAIETILKQIAVISIISITPFMYLQEFSLCPPPRVLSVLYHQYEFLSTIFLDKREYLWYNDDVNGDNKNERVLQALSLRTRRYG